MSHHLAAGPETVKPADCSQTSDAGAGLKVPQLMGACAWPKVALGIVHKVAAQRTMHER